MPSNSGPSRRMLKLGRTYSDELSTGFRRLILFAPRSGEIGRAHEAFLADVLRRFLPSRFRLATGFVACGDETSKQTDLVLFEQASHIPLLDSGSCVVVDRECVATAVEVKTSLDSRGCWAVRCAPRQPGGWNLAESRPSWRGRECAWALACEELFEVLAEDLGATDAGGTQMILVLEQYLPFRYWDGDFRSAPWLKVCVEEGQFHAYPQSGWTRPGVGALRARSTP